MKPLKLSQKQGQQISLFDGPILARAMRDAVVKLNPVALMRNPVIFVTEVVSVLVTLLGVRNLLTGQPASFALAIAVWLWLTVLFATFAEAVAEGRGRARAESLRRARTDTMAKSLLNPNDRALFKPVLATELKVGELVLVEATSFPLTAMSSRAWRASTKAPSPVNPRR
jgi:K+-transporting ATPase ATPase B chain